MKPGKVSNRESSLAKMEKHRPQMLIGAAENYAQEIHLLLKKRLRIVAIIFATCFLAAVVVSLVCENSTWRNETFFAGLLYAGIALWLGRKQQRTVGQLRLLELVIFGGAAFVAGGRSLSRASLHIESANNEQLLLVLTQVWVVFFSLAVLYGLLVPSTWKRTALIVGPFICFPFVFPLIAKMRHPEVLDACPNFVNLVGFGESAIFLLAGGIATVFATHFMTSLRSQAQESKKIGQYELKKKIGQGGMGEVWLAEHAGLARSAAIKLISSEALGDGFESAEVTRERFKREAKATARLQSPHTIDIYDFGMTQDGSFYYSMEYLDGLDLNALVKDYGPVPPERAIHFMIQICSSLEEAHHFGLVHRDVKPQNTFCCRFGLQTDFIKILDFGIVHLSKGFEESRLTQRGGIGTPEFIAPEMVAKNYEIDGRADIYALGCLGYWLLTGRLVFEFESKMEMAMAHAKTKPDPVSMKARQEIPRPLEVIIMSCLAKNPSNRPASAKEIREQLLQCQVDEPWTESRADRWWHLHRS